MLLLCVICLGVQTLLAQSTFRSGFLPHFNTSIKLNDQWKVNTKVEARFTAYRSAEENSAFDPEFDRTDIAIVLSKKTGSRNAIGGGYQVRVQNDKPEHRLIQQYAFGSSPGGLRIAHRIAADQTYSTSGSPEYRFRYRVAIELPLNGQSTDPGEWYLKFNQESLPSIQSGDFELELRALASLGFQINDRKKLEAGIDYRVSGIVEAPLRHNAWLSVGSFLSF